MLVRYSTALCDSFYEMSADGRICVLQRPPLRAAATAAAAAVAEENSWKKRLLPIMTELHLIDKFVIDWRRASATCVGDDPLDSCRIFHAGLTRQSRSTRVLPRLIIPCTILQTVYQLIQEYL